MHKVFRPEKKGDELRTAYLYADGHVVVVFERYMKDIGDRVQYVKIADLGVDCGFTGRVIFRDAGLLVGILALEKPYIDARTPKIERGSQLSKEKGVAVGSLTVSKGRTYQTHFSLSETPNFLDGAYCYQPEYSERYADTETDFRWAGYNIAARYPSTTRNEVLTA